MAFPRNNTVLTILSIFTLLIILAKCQSCPGGYFFNSQRCAPCLPNCQCQQQGTCKNCISGYTFDSTFTSCKQCPIASSSINIGCKQCCSQIIATQFVCSQCLNQTYVYLRGGQCIKMIGCSQMDDAGICSACDSGYYLYQSKCFICDISCQSCDDSGYCKTCALGYYNASSNASYSHCVACSAGCSVCSSSTVCTNCLETFTLSGSLCISCGANCLTCSLSACLTCGQGYTSISGTCQACTNTGFSGTSGCIKCTGTASIICTQCSSSYLLQSGGCTACSTKFANSLFCNSSGPIRCLNDMHSTLVNRYYLYDNTCVSNAKSCKTMDSITGTCSQCYFSEQDNIYYQLQNGACTQCSVTGCKRYSQTCKCLQCNNGYQFINNLCNPCQNLNCDKCTNNVQACTQCSANYGILSSACALCTKNNCKNCDGDFNFCTVCNQGFYLNNGSCFSCQTSCLTCTSSTECQSCTSGWYLTPNNRCKRLPTNCLQVYSQTGKCKKCSYGYMVIDGNCYQCGIDLFNFGQCQRYCPSYYLSRAYSFRSQLSILLLLGLLTMLFL